MEGRQFLRSNGVLLTIIAREFRSRWLVPGMQVGLAIDRAPWFCFLPGITSCGLKPVGKVLHAGLRKCLKLDKGPRAPTVYALA